MRDPFTGQPTCIRGGELPPAGWQAALQDDHERRLAALARFGAAAARVGIGTDPDDDLVLWAEDELSLLAEADALWHELDEAARAFRRQLPIVPLEVFGFPPDAEDLLTECGPKLRPISSGVEATAFEAEDCSIYKFYAPREDGRIGGSFVFDRGEEVALLAEASSGSYRAMLEKLHLVVRLEGMPTEVVGVTPEGVLIAKQALGERLPEGADTSQVQPPQLIPIPSRFLRAQRDHPRLLFVQDTPWLVADLHAKNLVRAADGRLRAIDLLAAPLPADLVRREPLLADWLRRVREDPAAPALPGGQDDEL
jgi:hypothetical protein